MEDGLIKMMVPAVISKLRDEYASQTPVAAVRSLAMRWRLTSAMQKSFRRKELERQELYMAGLLQLMPAYVWSRFCTVVMEDAGPGIKKFQDEFAVLLWLSKTKAHRAEFGVTDADLIRFARHFDKFSRCRSACDTIVAIHREPEWESASKKFEARLIEGPLADEFHRLHPCMKLALVSKVTNTAGVLEAVLKDIDPVAAWIAHVGVKRHEGAMFVLYPAIVAADDSTGTYDEPMPPSEMIGAYPTYAFDMHTSDGNRALFYFLEMTDVPFVQRVLELAQGDKKRAKAIMSEPLFYTEIGRLRSRRMAGAPGCGFGHTAQLRTLHACMRTVGVEIEMVPELLELLWDAIPALNYARQKVVKP